MYNNFIRVFWLACKPPRIYNKISRDSLLLFSAILGAGTLYIQKDVLFPDWWDCNWVEAYKWDFPVSNPWIVDET